MTPTRSTDISFYFTAPLSAWWLLVLLPIAAWLTWRLYRREAPTVAPVHRHGLVALRIGLIVTLIVLAFRPNLLYQQELRYPGRVLLVVDDSLSMTAADTRMTPATALRLHRALHEGDTHHESYHQMASALTDAAAAVRSFQRAAAQTDREQDAYWQAAQQLQQRIEPLMADYHELADAAPELAEAVQPLRLAAAEAVQRLEADLAEFYAGEREPVVSEYDRVVHDLNDTADRLWQLQGVLDAQAYAAGNEALADQVQAIRRQPRLELIGQLLRRHAGALQQALPEQYFQVVALGSQEQTDLASLPAGPLPARAGDTDLVGGLAKLAAVENDFPLTALVLLSDGRDLADRSPLALQQELVRRRVPIHGLGVGSTQEPTDLAVVRIIAPPFAVAGQAVTVRVDVKSALPAPFDTQLVLQHGERIVAEETFTVGSQPTEQLSIAFTPEQTGLFRFAVSLSPAADDAFTDQNNRAEFALHVRDEKIRVLLLDEKPRWQTRFVLNVLQRLSYVDLNRIILLVQDEGVLRRGREAGAWPQDAQTLGMYDLVLLGDLPPDVLDSGEWQALRDYVQAGGTLGLLAPGPGRTPVNLSASASAAPVGGAVFEDLRLTASGAASPMTRRLNRGVAQAEDASASQQVLLTDAATGAPMVHFAFEGQGKVFTLSSDELWRSLNPTQLDAHNDLFINLVTWAVQAGIPTPDAPLALEQRAYLKSQPIQLWLHDAAASISAVQDGQVIAQASAAPAPPGDALARAVFTDLPAVDLVLRDGAGGETDSLLVIDDAAELHHFSRDDAVLHRLARSTGGFVRDLANLKQPFLDIEPKQRIERTEHVWQLWDAWYMLTLLAVVLTVEWVWRKLVGLV